MLTEYRGLTVKALKELRRSLGDDATYAVSKNTLTTIAAREAGVDGIEEHLVGPTAIAFIDGDPVVVAKGLRDFARTNPLLVIKGGVLDGKFLDPDEVRKLADLESREVLLAKVAGGMQGDSAAGDLVGRRSAVAGRPAAGCAGGGRQGEPVADRRLGEPSMPTWRQRTPQEPTNAELGGRIGHRRRPSNTELAAADGWHASRSTRCNPEATAPPTIPRQHPLRKTTRKGRPSWRSSALPSSLTPSRS